MTPLIGRIAGILPNTWLRSGEPFNLSATLASGQVFRWRRDSLGIWWGSIDSIVLGAFQEAGDPYAPVRWQTFPHPDRLTVFEDLFRLDVKLEALYADWIHSEPAIEEPVAAFRGMRILRQPPVECFFSFQCASCNTVIKIERSVHKLAARYGEQLTVGEPDAQIGMDVYRFPTVAELVAADEQILRADLWGYRAPRVVELARRLYAMTDDWLATLRFKSYAEAHAALTALPGIGPKVADCICLFSLDKDDAVPIDTHTRQIAARLFKCAIASKSLTPRVYNQLADEYRSRFGACAGWAQQYLFFAELRQSGQFAMPGVVND